MDYTYYGDTIVIGGTRYRDISPDMTSDTEPVPYKVTCSSFYVYPAGYGHAFQAFASPPKGWTQSWAWGPAGGADPWVQIDLAVETKIDAFSSDSANNGMSLYGSNDGVSFELLCNSVTEYYQFDTPQTYRYYRCRNKAGEWNGLGQVRFFIKLDGRYLLKDGDQMKTIREGALNDIEGFATKELFEENGFAELSELNGVVDSLSDDFELLSWDEGIAPVIRATFIPNPQMVVPTGDIKVTGFEKITKVALTTTGTTGTAKVIVSFDKGKTWKTFKDNDWADIQPEVTAVGENGILCGTLSSIPAEKWEEARTDTLRFAYYLAKTAIADDIAVDTLTITGDMTGAWKKAIHGTDYDFEYPANDTLMVKLLTDGSYKINYMKRLGCQ